jgi:hypothetical protein
METLYNRMRHVASTKSTEAAFRLAVKYLTRLHPLNAIAIACMCGGCIVPLLLLALEVAPRLEQFGPQLPTATTYGVQVAVGHPWQALLAGLVLGVPMHLLTRRWINNQENTAAHATKALGGGGETA